MAFFLLPSGGDCPLLQVLAGKVVEEEVEGSLPWIVSWLLEGSNYTSILLRLDPQGGLGWGEGECGVLWEALRSGLRPAPPSHPTS